MKLSNVKWGKLSSCEILKLSFRNYQWGNSHWELSNVQMRKLYHKRIYWEMTKSVISQIVQWENCLKIAGGKAECSSVSNANSHMRNCQMLTPKFIRANSHMKLSNVKWEKLFSYAKSHMWNCQIQIPKFIRANSHWELSSFKCENYIPRAIYWEMTKSVISQIWMRKIEWKLQVK